MSDSAVLQSREIGASLEPVLGALLAQPAARLMKSLRVDLLSFVTERVGEPNKKPATHRALLALNGLLEDAELPELRELKIGPLFSFSLPKVARTMIRPKRAPLLGEPGENGFLEVFDEAWLEVLEAVPAVEQFGFHAGQRIGVGDQQRAHAERSRAERDVGPRRARRRDRDPRWSAASAALRALKKKGTGYFS